MKDIEVQKARDFLKAREKKIIDQKIKERNRIIHLLKNMKRFWEEYNIEKIYLYGTFTGLNFHNDSDIDLAVAGKLGFKELLKLLSAAGDYFKRELDIRVLDELPFKDEILKTGVLIYERENSGSQK